MDTNDSRSDRAQETATAPAIDPLHTHKWSSTDIDAVWHFLGRFGKYQLLQLALNMCISTSIATVIVSGMFTGKKVEHTCKEENVTALSPLTNQSVEVTSCYTKIINYTLDTISSKECTEFEFEGGNTILSYVAQWDLVCDQETLATLPQILVMVGMLVGAAGLSHLGDRFGRKKLLVGAFVGQLIVAALTAFVDNFGLFLFLKLLGGAFQQGVMVPIYNLELEVMPLELRPFVSLLQTSVWVFSACLTGVLGYFLESYDWRHLQVAYALIYVPGLMCLWFVDESLRWLVINGRVQEANKVMKKACSMNHKDHDKLMQTFLMPNKDTDQLLVSNGDAVAEKNREMEYHEESFHFKTLLVNKCMRKITLIMCYTWLICSMMYYGLTLMATSLAGDPYINYFLSTLAEFPAGVYTYFTMKTIGRKKTIMYSNAVAGCALLLAVLVSHLAPSSSSFQVLLISLPLVGKLAISGSFGTCWTYTPELYPTNLRSYGVGIASTAARISASFSPLFALLAQKVPWVPGTLFASLCFVGVFLMSQMPETRHRELPRTTRDVENWFRRKDDDDNNPDVQKCPTQQDTI